MKKLFLLLLLNICVLISTVAQSSSCPDDLLPRRFMSNGKMGFVDLFDNWKIKPKYFEVSPFENRFAKVRFGDFYGMINCEGKEVVPPKFEELSFFSFGRIWAKDAEGWHLWDSSGTELTKIAFDDYKRASIWHSNAWVKKNGKWKILDEVDGQIICEKEFTMVKLLSDTLSLVSNDSYFAIINHKNCQFKIPEEIVNAQKVSTQFIKLRFRNRLFDIINLKGESILKNPYHEILSAGNGLAKVRLGEQWGLITASGREILSLEYDSIKSYHYGRLALKKSGKWFFITENLFPVNDSLYDMVTDFFATGAMVKKANKWSLINREGQVLFAGMDSLLYNSGKLFAKNNNQWFLLPEKAESEKFSDINFKDNINSCRVKKEGKWAVYDFENSIYLIDPEYSSIEFISNEKIMVEKADNFGLIDISENSLIPVEYSNLEWQPGYRNNLFIAKKDDYVLVDEKNKVILNSSYPIIRQGKLFIVKDEKKQYLYQADGDLIYEDKIDSIFVMSSSNFFAIRQKGKWGLMDVKGKEILDRDYDNIQFLTDKHFALESDGIWEVFKENGNLVIDKSLTIKEFVNVFDKSVIVNTENGLIWLDYQSKIIAKNPQEYKILNSRNLAIKKSNQWLLFDREGRSLSNIKFDSILNKNGLELLQSNSKQYHVNSNGKLSVYLPFD
ncbi:WG repeat-containing protein [Hyphobacterium sp. CCMP332]|nr:WG repeat-containing protein [Hyphobacterium sp. CCMP332]